MEKRTKKTLFDSDSSGEDEPEKKVKEVSFNQKVFEGKKGKMLLELQKSF